MALDICENAKVSRPGVCNAAETLLVDAAVAESFLPRLVERLVSRGVTVAADRRAQTLVGPRDGVRPAQDRDWDAEYLDLEVDIFL